jgi:hypothetical protein
LKSRSSSCSIVRLLASAAGVATATYAISAGVTWLRYGPPGQPGSEQEGDALLDQFMPVYEAAERHHRRVAAPAEITLAAACELDLSQSMIVQSLFKTRAWFLGSKYEERSEAQGLLVQMKSLGWRVLAEIPGREIVVGAVTQPWMADVVFQGVPPEEFGRFRRAKFRKNRLDSAG